jgi:predicted SprT family Zn-dependent metalloprotease
MANLNSSVSLPTLRVSVSCKCGKQYAMPAAKRGKKFACKACGGTFKVPRESVVTPSLRAQILTDLGIDPDEASRKYAAESSSSSDERRVYRCSRCEGSVQRSELKGAYVNGELLCRGCRANLDVRCRREPEEEDREQALESVPFDERRALARTLGHTALFFAGSVGPLVVLAGVHGIVALGVGLAISVAGGALVHRTR